MLDKLEEEYITLLELSEETSIEYHTLLARLKRHEEKFIGSKNTKWGWVIHRNCIEQMKELSI